MSFGGEEVTSFNHNAALGSPDAAAGLDDFHISKQTATDLYTRFLLEFEPSTSHRIYRDQLQTNYNQNQYYVEVDLEHLSSWSGAQSPSFDMRTNLLQIPLTIVPIFETAATNAMKMLVPDSEVSLVPQFQVTFTNHDKPILLSELQGPLMNTVVVIQGIIISSVKSQIKGVELKLRCRNCRNVITERAESMAAYSTTSFPNRCTARRDNGQVDDGAPPCPSSPYEIVGDECRYIDVQELKLQDLPEQTPSGEVPRHVKLSCNRSLVDKVKPGSRVIAIGIYTTTGNKGRKSKQDGGRAVDYCIPYVSVLGIATTTKSQSDVKTKEQTLRELVNNSHNIFHRITKSMAPAILGQFGVKKALAVMMFGGTRRNLTDGTNLRGDINVLLLGDPSVAKSQFLKFASQVAPIAIYTSGKGSSAAGLTASVVRSQTTGDFHLEAGALVLADGGMVCIDEFDKMREQDRVAIHEAMEQQTISIAKAGITTVLNSRCAVLAAANPVFGRYDDMKSATENIDFQATILSRFDLIFILRDRSEDALDEALSTHIINTHKHKDEMNSTSAGMIDNFVNGVSNEASAQQQQQQQQQHQPQQQHQQDDNNGDDIIPPDVLKDLIAFSRTIHPCLTEAARLKIENEYVNLRQEMARTKRENPSAQVIPITVRQLEAMIRIAEAIARMSLTEEANEYHVQLAIDLFRSATGEAAGSSQQLGSGANLPAELGQLQQQCENFILNRLSPGQSIPTRALKNELVAQQFSLAIIDRVLVRLVDRKALAYQKQSKIIFRPNV